MITGAGFLRGDGALIPWSWLDEVENNLDRVDYAYEHVVKHQAVGQKYYEGDPFGDMKEMLRIIAALRKALDKSQGVESELRYIIEAHGGKEAAARAAEMDSVSLSKV